MDTVQLDGKCFTAFVKEGDRVTAGQKLVEFDMEGIKATGYFQVTPVVVTNTDDYLDGVELLGYTACGCVNLVSASSGEMRKRYGLCMWTPTNTAPGR